MRSEKSQSFFQKYHDKIANIFDYLIDRRYYVAVILLVVLVLLRFSGTAVVLFDDQVTEYKTGAEQSIEIGRPRPIRSDEWKVQTLFALSQNNNGFEKINDNISENGLDMTMTYYSPVLDINLIGNPFNLGFIFLGDGMGLSFMWVSYLLTLFLMSFEVYMVLTKKNKLLSFAAAFYTTYAPSIQWWFSSPHVDIVIMAFMMMGGLSIFVRTQKQIYKIISVLIILSGAVGMTISLYPPILVPVGFMVILYYVFMYLNNKEKLSFNKENILLLLGFIVVYATNIVYFLMTSKEAISAMLHTVYPGARYWFGGGFNLLKLFSHSVNIVLPYKDIGKVKEIASNNPEFSSFFSLIIPVAAYIFSQKERFNKKNFLFFLTVLIGFFLTILMFRMPEVLMKVTLLYFGNRLYYTVGIGLFIMTIIVAQKLKYNPFSKKFAALLSLLTGFFIYIFFINYFVIDHYIHWAVALGIIAFYIFAVYIYSIGKVKIFSFILIALTLVSGATINPLVFRAEATVDNKVLSEAVREIDAEDEGNWVSENNLSLFMATQGVNVLDGVHYHPDLELWRKIDPEGKYEKVYNRYAHINVKLVKEEKDTFVLEWADDMLVNVTVDQAKKLDIKYILGTRDLEAEIGDERLELMRYIESDNFYIYKIN